ncbi:methyltransferase type 11 [Plectosphaerella cucumerina]|uniref:Methyltransferase type 11 n=1 Tax=Plectosphaerella cucumerina TaxID=40658 RepID=A0A8K0TPN6_9PEZI|nr:methyltransferase type 11 [Plectosphaerella cucumerina]
MPSNGRLTSLIGPWRLIWASIQGLPSPRLPRLDPNITACSHAAVHVQVILELLRQDGIAALFRSRRIRDVAGTRLLVDTSEGFIAYENTTVVPSLVGKAHGKVVEIGTGPGNQIERYNPLLVERVYGVDPNSRFATAIAARLKQRPDLADKYRFVACGIEDTDILATEGISPGTIDTVVSIQSLCAVNDVKGVMRQAHRLLKPGGSFIFWEHEKSRDTVTGIAQAWSSLVGCNINRHIKADILAAGEWENPGEIEADDDPLTCLPRIWGVLRKKE